MSLSFRLPFRRTLRATVTAMAAAAACATASAALPQFTFDPAAGGIIGAPAGQIIADNILISDYSTVMIDFATGNFTDTGFLGVSSFQLGASTFTPAGLNSTYGLYFEFAATGTTSVANPATTPTFGSFSSLSYTLFGYTGTATFGFSGNMPTVMTTGAKTPLANGTLDFGTVGTIPSGGGKFIPFASATVKWNVIDTPFFAKPIPFYTRAETSFINTNSETEPFSLPGGAGFRIRQGGGSVNFVSTVPEPGTYGLLLSGLAAVGFIARRRRG